MATFQGGSVTQAGWIFKFISDPVFTTGLATVIYLPPPLFGVFAFFSLTLIESFVFHCYGSLLRPVFPISVHSADESVISPHTCFVDLVTSIVRVFLDSLRFDPCEVKIAFIIARKEIM